LGLQYFCCSVGSILTDLFGPRMIGVFGGLISFLGLFLSVFVKDIKIYYLTYGICFGIGQALLITSTMAILPHYFNKRLSLANGIMNALSAIIVVILPVLTSKIIHSYSLMGLFYFLSGLNLLTVIMAFTYKPLIRHDRSLTKKERLKHSFGISVLKKKGFVVWCIASFIACFGWLIPIIVIVIN
jgi:MFS family permease